MSLAFSHTPCAAYIGDTLHRIGVPVDPMPGFKPAKAMVRVYVLTCDHFQGLRVRKVYAGVYPVDSNDFLKLEESIKRVRPSRIVPCMKSDSTPS